ncbi:hypothetical protein PS000_23990, partial [Shigella sonnei]|nr:hypothetical protein [Shigella sonnei]
LIKAFILRVLRVTCQHSNGFIHKIIAMLASDPQHTKYKCLDQDILNILIKAFILRVLRVTCQHSNGFIHKII